MFSKRNKQKIIRLLLYPACHLKFPLSSPLSWSEQIVLRGGLLNLTPLLTLSVLRTTYFKILFWIFCSLWIQVEYKCRKTLMCLLLVIHAFLSHVHMIHKWLYPAPGGVSGIMLRSLIKLFFIHCWYHDSIVLLISPGDVLSFLLLSRCLLCGKSTSLVCSRTYVFTLWACQVSDRWMPADSILLNLPGVPG